MDCINKEFAGIAGYSNNDAEDHPYFNWDSEETIIYSESHLDDLEAPVIYLTPPVVLPDEQMEADKELEDILIDTGLEKRPKAVDPFQITDTDTANTAIKVSKTKIDNLRHKRSALMRTMRETATFMSSDHSKHVHYRSQSQELKEVEKQLDEELIHLLKLEHVKKSLSKLRGAGHDTEVAEEELEDRENELAKAGFDDDDEEGLEEDDGGRSYSDEL
nr:hypothetical protein [Babesia bovis]